MSNEQAVPRILDGMPAKSESGFAVSDLLSERFWALGPDSPEGRGLLPSYVIGARAAKLDELNVQSRVQQTLRFHVRKVGPAPF